jgi:NDP-sugar pyrophosphorylase family protein
VKVSEYVGSFPARFPFLDPNLLPWQVTTQLPSILERLAASIDALAFRSDGVLIHPGAVIEQGATVKPPAMISEGCFIAATAYLRGGVFLDRGVIIGTGCELKTSVIMAGSTLAHFNFVGDSIVGADVNLEAGAIVANHHNDRDDKEVRIHVRGQQVRTGAQKFGALIGDHCRIGANAVLAPGTVLDPRTIVGRLVLVDQGGG